MINKVQFFNEEISNLIDARIQWNKLSDHIYSIAGGELESTSYWHIYSHYEKALKKVLISIIPEERAKAVEKYFEAMILEFAENKCLTFKDKHGNSQQISDPSKMLDAIIAYEYVPLIVF